MRRPIKATAQAVAQSFAERGVVEVKEWNGWTAGQVVGVDTVAGSFTIQSFRLDPTTGTCRWVNVVGGKRGRNDCRSFLLSKIQAKPRGRGKRK